MKTAYVREIKPTIEKFVYFNFPSRAFNKLFSCDRKTVRKSFTGEIEVQFPLKSDSPYYNDPNFKIMSDYMVSQNLEATLYLNGEKETWFDFTLTYYLSHAGIFRTKHDVKCRLEKILVFKSDIEQCVIPQVAIRNDEQISNVRVADFASWLYSTYIKSWFNNKYPEYKDFEYKNIEITRIEKGFY